MKSKNHNFKEKPFQRVGRSYPEDVKRRIVLEINSGRISQRGAERLYCINRRTLDKWITQISLLPLESKVKPSNLMNETSENEQVKLMSKQIKELQKALANAQLKIDGLQTLIEVSEQELKIKIRKKLGAKRSKE